MTYACVRTDNMSGTINGESLVSGRYLPGSTPKAIENGNVVKVGALIEGERELRTLDDVAANTPLVDVALVASEEVVKSKTRNTLDEFINEAGAELRCYRFNKPKQIFSVTKEAFAEGSVYTVGNTVELAAGTKLKVVASPTEESTKVGTLIAIEGKWYVVETE